MLRAGDFKYRSAYSTLRSAVVSSYRVAMFNSNLNAASVDSLTHVIQVALTPVFLLSAIAALLNVFSSRLGCRPRLCWNLRGAISGEGDVI
jgi:hypothetical protein